MEQLFIEMLHYSYLRLWPATADGKITVLHLFIAYDRWSYVEIIV